MRPLVIDASVFVSAARASEPGHAQSLALLEWVGKTSARVFLPTLVLAEVAAALSRSGLAAQTAQSYALGIGTLPSVILVPLDAALAREAATLAAQRSLRGADSIYLAAAALVMGALVTLDREQRERSAGVVTALSPRDFLEQAQADFETYK